MFLIVSMSNHKVGKKQTDVIVFTKDKNTELIFLKLIVFIVMMHQMKQQRNTPSDIGNIKLDKCILCN